MQTCTLLCFDNSPQNNIIAMIVYPKERHEDKKNKLQNQILMPKYSREDDSC